MLAASQACRVFLPLLLLLLVGPACAAATPPVGRRTAVPSACAIVRMESVEQESDKLPVHSTSLVLVYRPPDTYGNKSQSPVSTKIEVRQERVADLKARLQARPEVICEPDPNAPGGYRLSLP